jgi:hypothetical protein
LKILAIERWRDVKAAICEHRGDPAQCLAIGYTQGNVVCDARACVTRPMGRNAKKIHGDRSVRGAIEEAEHRAFLPKLLKTQSLRQKLRRVLKPIDLNLDRTNPPNCSIGWSFSVLIIRACFGGFLDKSQFETIRIPEAQTLLSKRPGVACHVRASLHQAVMPTLQCPGWHRKNNGAYVTKPA